VYTLSNHNQNVMSGLWKDLPYKITKKVKENWLDNLFFLVPVVGTYQCAPDRAPRARPRPTARPQRPGVPLVLQREGRCSSLRPRSLLHEHDAVHEAHARAAAASRCMQAAVRLRTLPE
jgi:hypothetical protein